MKLHMAPCLPAGRYRLSPIAKQLLFCVLSSILLILSFPNFNLWVCAWFGFLPLFIALEGQSKRKAFLFSYLSGVVFWAGAIYWLVHVTLPGTIILVLYLALYFAFFGLLASYLLSTTHYIISIPCAWVLLEYIRSYLFTGFPWALLGYSQSLNLPAIQIADITGAWGVSFLIIMVNVGIYSLSRNRETGVRGPRIILISLFCLVIVLTYGYYKIYEITGKRSNGQGIKISVIQPNIAQDLKWDSGARDFIRQQYFSLTRQAAKDNPSLIIWPEAASPEVIGQEQQYFSEVKDLAREVRLPLLFGAVLSEGEFYYNSALLLSKEGVALGRYDKIHLVPFGEYIPLKNIFGFLETIAPIGDIAAGKEYTIFSLPAKFSVLICFEDLFPELSRRFIKRGAAFLVVITNDAWYKKTPAASQHLQASVFRAVENRVFLTRAANTGVSGFIHPTGRASLFLGAEGESIFINGYKTEEIKTSLYPLSFYTRYGDIFVFVCLVFIFYGIIPAFKRKK